MQSHVRFKRKAPQSKDSADPEVGVSLACLRRRKRAGGTGAQQVGRGRHNGKRRANRDLTVCGLELQLETSERLVNQGNNIIIRTFFKLSWLLCKEWIARGQKWEA